MTSVFGFHSVREQLARAPERVHRLVVLKERRDRRRDELIAQAKNEAIRVQYVSRPALDRMCDGGNHQGVYLELHAVELATEQDLIEKFDNWVNPLILVLEDIQDPGNLGACFRTAAAAGVDAILLPKNRTAPLNPTVLKTASGTVNSLFIAQVSNLARTLDKLKEKGVWLVGADSEGSQSYLDVDLTGPVAILFGNEESGLRRLTKDLCDYLVRIPISDSVESLNVSVANGILLFEAKRQRAKPS